MMRSMLARIPTVGTYVAVITALTFGILWLIPANDVILMPGSAQPTCSLVHVQGGKCEDTAGGIFDTYVNEVNANHLLYVVLALLKPDVTVTPAEDVTGNCPSGQYETQLMQMMADSKINAEAAALSAAGYRLHYQSWGPQVLEVDCGTPAAAALQEGDRIMAVDGHAITGRVANGTPWRCRPPFTGLSWCSLYQQVRDYVAARGACKGITLGVLRAGKRTTVHLQTIAVNAQDVRVACPKVGEPLPRREQALLGIDLAVPFKFPVKINISTHDVGGPSAGLAFALAIYQELTHQDLTRGNRVAVTGEIDFEQVRVGRRTVIEAPVGAIGGAKQKAIAASAAGARYFLVPTANYSDAMSAGTGLIIKKVDSLQDAIRVLRSLPPASTASG
jgi:PDZ domain-containing protein